MKLLLMLNFSLFTFSSFSQHSVFLNDYRTYEDIKDGVYEQQSTSDDYLELKLPLINSIEIDTTKELNFIKIEKTPIVLFNDHRENIRIPTGKLTKTTQVVLDSTFYKEIYRDFSKPWHVTFNVWNRVIIDGKGYYSDYDIHDSAIVEIIPELNQKVLIIGQNTGYDYAYHLGYPEFYFLIFLDVKNQILYESDILDITIGNEFGMKRDFLKTRWNAESKVFEMVFFNNMSKPKKQIKLNWNGKSLEILDEH